MIEITKTKEILKNLESVTLNSPEDFKAMVEMNDAMEKVRKEYIIKSTRSEYNASQCYLTTQI